jgi:hypothetical protein
MEVKNTTGKLPFDILCMIFEQYAKFDNRFIPLETLLLVSKCWHNTALRAIRLWSSFEMHIRHIEDLYYWDACIMRRLNRCPPPVLLDICIDIRFNLQDNKGCDTLLMQLAGKSGEVAKRWRRFVLNDPSFCIPGGVLKQCVSFPTPNLEDFRLDYVRIRGDLAFLPDAPSLRIFHLTGRDIPMLPNLSSATDLSICVGGVWGGFNEQAIAKAINLVTMKIDGRAPFKLTATYKRLRSLHLEGRLSEGSLSTFSAPILTNLTLALAEGKGFHHLVSCKGINPGTLRKVHIQHGSDTIHREEIPEYLDGVRRLLTAAINLELLILEHTPIAHSILELLVNDRQWLNQCHSLRVVLQEGAMEWGVEPRKEEEGAMEWDVELRKEENRAANMDQLMKDIGCVDGCVMMEHWHGNFLDTDEPIRLLSLWSRF